jgi:hypothetical protein
MSLINDALRRANADKSRGQSPAPVPPMQPVEPPPSSILPWAILILGVAVLAIAAALFFRSRPQETKVLSQNQSANPPTVATAPANVSTPVQPSPDASAEVPAAEPRSAPVPQSLPPQQPAVAAIPASAPEPVQPTPATAPPTLSATPAATVLTVPPQPVQEEPSVTPAESNPSEVKVAAITPTPTTPTAPVETKAAATPEARESQGPRLQAIYYRLKKPTVVINGKTLGLGQSVDGIKVISIQRTSVEVVQAGKYRTLTLQD